MTVIGRAANRGIDLETMRFLELGKTHVHDFARIEGVVVRRMDEEHRSLDAPQRREEACPEP
jgi:hypothetical protein